MGGHSAQLGYGYRQPNADTWRGRCAVALALVCIAPAFGAVAIERATLHQYEDGPILPASHIFLPGETVFFSCRLIGYQSAADGKTEGRVVNLSWRLEMTDPEGIAIVPPAAGKIAEPVTSRDKDWLPKFVQSFAIPGFAPPGVYRIRIAVSDLVSKTDFSTDLSYEVRGHPVEPSKELTARNLHFLKSEQDGAPLNPVVYRPGQTLWARFDITGFGYGEGNKFSVEYGLAVLRESGEQVFAEPAAARDANQSFYRQRYVPGALSLELKPDVPAGAYILSITMEDKIGGAKAEIHGGFRIER